MEQLRLPTRRRSNYVGSGYRIYSNPQEDDPHPDRRDADHSIGFVGETPARPARKGRRGARSPQVDIRDGDDLKGAAALLIKSGALLFDGLCESCSQILHQRLAAISSQTQAAIHVSTTKSSGGIEEAGRTLFSDLDKTKDRGEQVIVSEQPEQGKAPLKQEPSDGDGSLPAVSGDITNGMAAKMSSISLFGTPNRTEGNVVGVAKKTDSLERVGPFLQLPRNISENARVQQIRRKKDFVSMENINGRPVNVVEGLELHTNVFTDSEQKELLDFIHRLQELGRNQKLRRRTYSEPRKWMRGKGRVTIQFGCCYNYAVDKDGNPPGIIQDEEVDPIPQMLRMVIKRLVRWHVLPRSSVPDSCIINLYDVGDCIPPHIDHHDFVRPFCTVSLLSECDIVFGSNLKIIGPGDFKGSISIPLPVGSVLVLNGNGADVAKHAVPAVPTRRVSITFRKMDLSKVPQGFTVDHELLGTQPLTNARNSISNLQGSQPSPAATGSSDSHFAVVSQKIGQNGTPESKSSHFSLESDFPPLHVSGPGLKR